MMMTSVTEDFHAVLDTRPVHEKDVARSAKFFGFIVVSVVADGSTINGMMDKVLVDEEGGLYMTHPLGGQPDSNKFLTSLLEPVTVCRIIVAADAG